MKFLLVILPALFFISLGPVFAQDLMDTQLTAGGGGTFDNQNPAKLSAQEKFRIDMTSSVFDLHGGLTSNSDQVYGPDIANFSGNNKTLFNNYYFIDDGYMVLKAVPRMTFTAGRMPETDQVDTPYSLFFNSKNLAASGAQIRYEDPNFLFEDRWISLDSRSGFPAADTPPAWGPAGYGLDGFPDRGADVKSFIFKKGTMRFGFQDGVVYAGRSFDPNYFFNPLPQYFTQYFYAMGGRPWSTDWTDKYHFGGFWDWKESDFDVVAQVLVNDFSLHFLLPSMVPNNPWKAAWSLGGSVKTDWGRFGLYHAGALKYTFEPITASSGSTSSSIQNAVGMTYIPDVEYWANGGFQTVQVEDNAIGYLHGENNIAFMVTWDYDWTPDWKSRNTLEYLVAGNNSPANPWQDANASNDVGTQLLNDGLLEQQIAWSSRWSYHHGPWGCFIETTLGIRINPLTLANPDLPANSTGWAPMDTLVQIYKPAAGIAGIERLSIGGTYTFDTAPLFQ